MSRPPSPSRAETSISVNPVDVDAVNNALDSPSGPVISPEEDLRLPSFKISNPKPSFVSSLVSRFLTNLPSYGPPALIILTVTPVVVLLCDEDMRFDLLMVSSVYAGAQVSGIIMRR